jgi:hypothetical protein
VTRVYYICLRPWKYSWQLEGFTSSGGHSPYTLLIGIALSNSEMIKDGNICVHSGSHVLLQEAIQEKVGYFIRTFDGCCALIWPLLCNVNEQIRQRSTIFSEQGPSAAKPDLGEPTRIFLRVGFICVCVCIWNVNISLTMPTNRSLLRFIECLTAPGWRRIRMYGKTG